ncbi:hypothetical protein ACF0H5_001766 [Mactra antiquata]
MSYNILLENIIRDVGGCGRFQWITAVIVYAATCIVSWSILAMTFNGQQPDFMCSKADMGNSSVNQSVFDNVCHVNQTDNCDGYIFNDDINTVVNEWNLVCDSKWIVAMITTIQIAGDLVGCFISGHLGDMIGRKPTFFLSLIILILFNIIAYFSINWQMYATIRFFIGMEITPTRWRAIIISVPAWTMGAGIFALACWGLRNWRSIHLVTAATGLPVLFTICFVQESPRLLLAKRRYDDAENVIKRIANINGKPAPNMSKVIEEAKEHENETKPKYSVLYLFKSRHSIKLTIGLLFIWMIVSYTYYGLTFGIQSLAGDLYLNMLLMNTIECPAFFSIMFIANKFGSKYCCILFFMLSGICGLVVGVIQYVDTPHSGLITNVFALASKMGIAVGWRCLIVYTIEIFPTVVRTTAYGLCNTSARIGGMVAPQIVFLNDKIPGLMYFLSAVLMIISSVIFFTFPDTKDKPLEETLESFNNNIQSTTEHNTVKIHCDSNGNEKANPTENETYL